MDRVASRDRRWLALVAGSVAMLAACALLACANTGRHAPSGNETTGSSAKESVPTLQIVDAAPSGTYSFQPGSRLGPGHQVLMTGASVVSVAETETFDPLQPRGRSFILTFDAAGAAALSRITTERVGYQFAFVIGGEVLEAPVVQSPILGGSLTVTTDSPRMTQLMRDAIKPR